MKIGVFDSGIGGLNVLKELINTFPNNEYIFYGDTANLPYGEKNKDELNYLSSKIVKFLINKKVDLIIIACGTVSSTCFEYLKSHYDIPIYDIITPTINYLNNSDYQNIGIIATTRTINSKIFEQTTKNIIVKETPLFVPMIENNIVDIKNVEWSLMPLKGKIDALVLGCTHYPLLKREIANYLHCSLIDMGKCLVDSINITNDGSSKIELYFSKLNPTISNNIKNIINSNYNLYEI